MPWCSWRGAQDYEMFLPCIWAFSSLISILRFWLYLTSRLQQEFLIIWCNLLFVGTCFAVLILIMLLQKGNSSLLSQLRQKPITLRPNWKQVLIFWDLWMRYSLRLMTDLNQSTSLLWTIALYQQYVFFFFLQFGAWSFVFFIIYVLKKFTWQSYDATTHFESTVDDVLNMYTLITGKVRCETETQLKPHQAFKLNFIYSLLQLKKPWTFHLGILTAVWSFRVCVSGSGS